MHGGIEPIRRIRQGLLTITVILLSAGMGYYLWDFKKYILSFFAHADHKLFFYAKETFFYSNLV
jgi:hypothetical protein